MKTRLCIAFLLLVICSLPVLAADATAPASDSNSKIKALEAEVAALRAQLQAQHQIRGEDRNRPRGDRGPRQQDRTASGNGHEEGREIQIDFTVDSEGDLNNMPEFIREMVMSQRDGDDTSHEMDITFDRSGEEMFIIANGEKMFIGDRAMDHEGEHRDQHHQVMEFSLGDVAPGMDGDVRIEIMGDAGLHLSPEAFGMAMSAMMGDEDWDEDRGIALCDEITEKIVWLMEEHGMPIELLEQTMEEQNVRGEGDLLVGMDMLMDRLEAEGYDPGPIAELRHELIERLEGRDDGRHADRHEDPYMQQGGEFVGKMFMSEEIANALSDRRAMSIFCIWEARQHLEPQERLEALFPVMINDEVDMAVRNAAAMVVRQSFFELGDREKAIEALRNQILINEGIDLN